LTWFRGSPASLLTSSHQVYKQPVDVLSRGQAETSPSFLRSTFALCRFTIVLNLHPPTVVIMKFLSSLLLFIAPIALALPTSVVKAPVSDVEIRANVVCGSNSYTSAQLSAARKAAANYVSEGDHAGSSTYPHVYNNYEGFDFLVSGTYYEFPILKSGVYTGGKLSRSPIVAMN
jgi:hypothetical protein